MPCPYFWPSAPDPARRAARAPLGVIHTGTCTLGGSLSDPELCNFGYARDSCIHFPPDAPADAVRFDRDVYILERNHLPVEFGVVNNSNPGATIERQFAALSEWLKPLR